jgi:dihydrofolate reductase
MRRLTVFDQVTLDGRFTDAKGDMSWAHKPNDDAEWNEFVAGNADPGGPLVFGRVTYQMMASYWPTPAALHSNPVVARQMNDLPKFVFSRTLHEASWKNTTLLKGDLVSEVRALKAAPGADLTILGSGSIVAQLTQARLIDEFLLVLNPIALGSGRTIFDGVKGPLTFKQTTVRSFANGNVLVCYEPVADDAAR